MKAELLTGDEIWDMFLTYIQGSIETTNAHLRAFDDALADPDLVDDHEIRRIRISAIRCRERISAWQAVVELPKDLKKLGEDAKGLVERLDSI